MLKQAVKRGLFGIPLGISITFVITIIISLAVGDGYYHPVVPTLAGQFGGEIGAVVFQTVLAGLMWAVAWAASIIWDIEKWSYAKQTGVYFIIISVIMLPGAHLLHWIPRTFAGFLLYIVIFVVIYAIICTVNYVVWRAQIKKINSKIPR